MKKRMLILLTVALFVAAFTLPANAQRGPGGHGKMQGQGFCNGNDLSNVQGLNLTAEQKAKISDLRTAHLKDVKPLQDKMHSLRGDLRLLWLEKNPDEAKIRAKEKEIRTLRDQMQDKGQDYRWAVYKSLTPEQQQTLKQNRMTGRCFGPNGQGAGQGMGKGMGPGMGQGAGAQAR